MEKNKALTEALQTIATEHHELKQSLCKSRRSSALSALTGDDDFYDAVSGQQPAGDSHLPARSSVNLRSLLCVGVVISANAFA